MRSDASTLERDSTSVSRIRPRVPPLRPLAWYSTRWTVAATAAAILPIVVATARAIHNGWVPVGDNGILAVRSRDVLSARPPLLGTWSSASVSIGEAVNNPGPLLFEVLAVPTRLFGASGIAIGVAIVNVLAVVGVAVFAYRRGGPLVAAAAVATATALAWTMGSELLYEPWQPHSLVLPFLCFLVLVWSVACGDLVALPLMAGVGSLLLQTHLSYGFLVPGLCVWAVVGLVLVLRRHRSVASSPALARRVVAITVVALAVLWAPPLVEQLFGSGEGNLDRLASNLGEPTETLGYGFGARLVSSVVALPPWWFRPSFQSVWLLPGSTDLAQADLPPPAAAAVSLAGLAAALSACLWISRRRDLVSSRAVTTGVISLAVGLLTTGRTPISYFGIPVHQFRWLWPLAAFLFLTIIVTLARRCAESPTRAKPVITTLVTATLVLSALNLASSNQGTSAPQWSVPVSADLARQLSDAVVEGPVYFDLSGAGFGDPYSGAIMAALQRAGIPFLVEPVWVRQLGEGRRFTGVNAEVMLLQRVGPRAGEAPPGARLIALHEGLQDAEQAELSELREQIAAYIRAGDFRLNRRGQEAFDDGEFPSLMDEIAGSGADPDAFFVSGTLVRLIDHGLLDVDGSWERRFERYAELQHRLDRETVALYLAPLDGGAEGS